MTLELTLSGGDRARLAIPEGSDEEAEMEAIERREGRYATGWATLDSGKRIRLEEIRAMRVLRSS